MKLYRDDVLVDRSSNFESQYFGIDDVSIIFDILRSKLYSNPIGAIVREIACNARDAHIELNKADLPIEITLPSRLDPTFQVKDWGPGISTSRMADVFVKYTASTKRGDNNQVGGWGIGSKSPFSYSDSFTVITTVDGTQYTYAAYIDETRVGKVDLLNEISTDDPNGTRIIVPVKPSDYNAFKQEVMKNLYFWDVKPILKGISPAPEFNTNKGLEVLISGKGWEVWRATDRYSHNYNEDYYDSSNAIIIIGGIPYKVTTSDLGLGYESNHYRRHLLNQRLRLYFDIGAITLSANREYIHFDEKTQKLIKDKLALIADNIAVEMQKRIDVCSCLTDAEITLGDLRQTFANVCADGQKFTWNQIPLKGCVINNLPSLQHAKIMEYAISNTRRSGVKLSCSQVNQLHLGSYTEIFIHDLPTNNMPAMRIRKYLDEHPTVKTVQVVKFHQPTVIDEWEAVFNFKKLTTKNISSMEAPEKVKRDPSTRAPKAGGFVYSPSASYRSSGMWEEASLIDAVANAADGDKLLYVILKDKRSGEYTTSGGDFATNYSFGRDLLNLSMSCLGISDIYSVKEKDVKKLDQNIFQPLGEALFEKYEELKSQYDLAEILSLINVNEHTISYRYYDIWAMMIKNNVHKISDKDGVCMKYISASNVLTKKSADDKTSSTSDLLIRLSSIFGKKSVVVKDHPIKALAEEFGNRYKLLSSIRSYGLTLDVIESIIEYINNTDAKYKGV